MSLTNYGENLLLTDFEESVATPYLALFTASPTDTGGGTEVTGGAYARQAMEFGTPTSGSITTTENIEFPEATADWGTVTSWGVFDAITGGNLVWYGNLETSKAVTAGDIFRVTAGNVTLSLD